MSSVYDDVEYVKSLISKYTTDEDYQDIEFRSEMCRRDRNNCYYGFGLGASGYLRDVRYSNTRSITHYLQREDRYEERCV